MGPLSKLFPAPPVECCSSRERGRSPLNSSERRSASGAAPAAPLLMPRPSRSGSIARAQFLMPDQPSQACYRTSAQLVERGDLEVERLVGGAPTPVRGDDHAVDFAAGAGDLDWPRVGGG